MTQWIVQPNLWEVVKRSVEKTFPIGSRVFWKKVLTQYLRRGGKLLIVQPDPEEAIDEILA